MYDDPRVAVGPAVLSESARQRGWRQNRRPTTRRQVICGGHGGAGRAETGAAVADAGRTRAAEGKACRQFFAPEIGRTHFRSRKKWRHNPAAVAELLNELANHWESRYFHRIRADQARAQSDLFDPMLPWRREIAD